ncbi:MAG TPA: hypothetical protein PLY87_28285, partial [Planctomycetaceae bacterium]|nr:hypothetical protein [Planctomycetaceae bacterium]
LKDAKSIRLALRMISEENAEPEQETAPRSERKSGQVEVVEPDDEPDDDPTPDPPTIRKTAKGSKKVKEADKPKTAAITPEIIDEPKESFPEETTLSDFSEQQILDFLVATADEPKPRAKRLRKVADRLDPPGDGRIPTRPQLVNAIPETWSDPLKQAATDWAAYKQARKKDDRIQSIRAWQIALKQMTEQPESNVVQKINNAIANSYKGWNHDSGIGPVRNAAATQSNGSCLGANGRPEIKPRKINYK